MNKLILIGHGNYGTGMKSALKRIVSIKDTVEAVDFIDGMNEDAIKSLISSNISKEDSYIICCDLIGGTPFKVSAGFYEKGRIEIVTGANFMALVEAVLSLSMPIDDIKELLVDKTKQSVSFFKLERRIQETEAEADGI